MKITQTCCSSIKCFRVYFIFEGQNLKKIVSKMCVVMWLLVAWGCGLNVFSGMYLCFCPSVRLLSGWWPLTVQPSPTAGHHSRCHSSRKFRGHTLTSQETWKTDTRYVCHKLLDWRAIRGDRTLPLSLSETCRQKHWAECENRAHQAYK